MKSNGSVLFRRIFGIILSVSILLAGICLIAGCLSIYYSGAEQLYTRAAVAQTFKKIAAPVYICLALTVAGFVWELISPSKPKAQKPKPAYLNILNRLSAKKDITGKAAANGIFKERKLRKTVVTVRTALLLAASFVFFSYALNSANFDRSNINGSMIRAMWVMLPCLAVPFGYSVFAVFAIEKSIKREIELLKSAPAADTPATANAVNNSRKINVSVIRTALIVIAIAILIFGFFSGGTADVLTKAVNICTECIGLG